MITIFIAHMASGKSTFVKAGPNRFDDDDARVPASEPVLAELRAVNDWDNHNLIWHQMLRNWAKHLPKECSVTAHTLADAMVLAEAATFPSQVVFILVPAKTWSDRLAKRNLNRDEIRLAHRNREDVIKEIALNPDLPVLADFPV